MEKNKLQLVYTGLLIALAGCGGEYNAPTPVESIEAAPKNELTIGSTQERADRNISEIIRKYAMINKIRSASTTSGIVEKPIEEPRSVAKPAPKPAPTKLKPLKPLKPLTPIIDVKKTPTKTVEANPIPPVVNEGYQWPVQGKVLKKFGRQPNGEFHNHILIETAKHSPVKAARQGVVKFSKKVNADLGHIVLIRHDNNYISAYGKLANSKVEVGDEVYCGQVIGTTANKSLHFEIRKGEKSADPMGFLP